MIAALSGARHAALYEIADGLDRRADNVVHALDLAPHLGEMAGGLLPRRAGRAKRVMDMTVRFAFRERVFAWWHIAHGPAGFIVVIGAVAHVVVVHVY
jgi:hypothetical protein